MIVYNADRSLAKEKTEVYYEELGNGLFTCTKNRYRHKSLSEIHCNLSVEEMFNSKYKVIVQLKVNGKETLISNFDFT